MTLVVPLPPSVVVVCQHCAKEFKPVAVVKKDKQPRSHILEHADHEWQCPQNPLRQVAKESKAWNPAPYPAVERGGAKPQPKEDRILFLDGPWHGRVSWWDGFLIDGTRLEVEPPRIMMGPTVADSTPRMCTRYMGHYELRLKGGCPIYRWVDTIAPKKRLSQPRTFIEAWPELAAQLTEETNDDNTELDGAEGTDGDGDGEAEPDPVLG